MKKLLCLILSVIFIFSLTGCYSKEEQSKREKYIKFAEDKIEEYLENKYNLDNIKIKDFDVVTERDGDIDFSPTYLPVVGAKFIINNKEYTVACDVRHDDLEHCYDNYQEIDIATDIIEFIEEKTNNTAGSSFVSVHQNFPFTHDFCDSDDRPLGLVNYFYDGDIENYINKYFGENQNQLDATVKLSFYNEESINLPQQYADLFGKFYDLSIYNFNNKYAAFDISEEHIDHCKYAIGIKDICKLGYYNNRFEESGYHTFSFQKTENIQYIDSSSPEDTKHINSYNISENEIKEIEEIEFIETLMNPIEFSEEYKEYYYFINTEDIGGYDTNKSYYILQLTIDEKGEIISHFNSLRINDYCIVQINNIDYMVLHDTNFNFNKGSTHWTISVKE